MPMIGLFGQCACNCACMMPKKQGTKCHVSKKKVMVFVERVTDCIVTIEGGRVEKVLVYFGLSVQSDEKHE